MMTAVLLLVSLVLAGAVAALVAMLRRVEGRLAALESRGHDTRLPEVPPAPTVDPVPVVTAEEFVITRLGEPDAEPPTTMEARLFADVVVRESVVKVASWAYGVRRGLSPANRNRIWFEMRREVKRARKERKVEEREAIREYRARRRAAAQESEAA
jgi:hypothetical protein